MVNIYNDILDIFKKNPNILFGISNIDFSEYKSNYKCALVFAVPHTELLGINDYKEEKFENLICEARDCINLLLEKITTILKQYKIQYYIPPVAQSSEETLIAPFSFKFASVNAGLGWIGKNDVLITEKYGPRIRLSAILINYKLCNQKRRLYLKTHHRKHSCGLCMVSCPIGII